MSTSYDANTHLMKNRGDPVGQAEYAQIIRSLMHLMKFYRLDIAYAVCRLSRYTHNLNNDHWSVMVPKIKATHRPRTQAQGTRLETSWHPPWGRQKSLTGELGP